MSGPRSFNFADIWEMAADAVPERDALVVGEQRRTYAELEDRANRLAQHLAGEDIGPGDHVALYLDNCAEYVEAMLAAFKLRAVPINVNYRYVADELRYLLDNSDSAAVITQPALRSTADDVVDSTDVRFVLSTGEDYEQALEVASAQRPSAVRSGDDRYILYTGGTTGMPKGVVWRQEDAFFACLGGGDPLRMFGPVERPDQLPERIVDQPVSYMSVAPLMHAAAQWMTLSWIMCGSKSVLTSGSLDPAAVWRAVQDEKVNALTVVGDAIARRLLDEWDAGATATSGEPPYDTSSLFVFSNGGAPLSSSMRQRVFAALPHVMLADGFGSSEAGTQGSSRVSAADETEAGESNQHSFNNPAKPTIVIDINGDEVVPGSGAVGHVLAGGRLPLGYYNDPKRTADSFVERNGERWLITGDMASVAADGAIVLAGRGSGVINTGGEKVFPEEVEGVLKVHPTVYDCVVVGVEDEEWGNAVTAVVQPADGNMPTLDDLVTHCKSRLAGFKAPKRLILVDAVVRTPSGKADYTWAKAVATT